MSAKQQDQQQADREKHERQKHNALIGKHVMDTLGQPGNLHCIQVRRLWDNHYRVNVLTGMDASCAKVANSYFLVADEDGNVVTTNPKLTKEY